MFLIDTDLGSGGDRDYSFQGILTCGWEVSDAPEGRIQEDEPERGGEAPQRLQGGHGGTGQVHDRRAPGVHPRLRPEAPAPGAALERPLVLSASARRPYLEAESERLELPMGRRGVQRAPGLGEVRAVGLGTPG